MIYFYRGFFLFRSFERSFVKVAIVVALIKVQWIKLIEHSQSSKDHQRKSISTIFIFFYSFICNGWELKFVCWILLTGWFLLRYIHSVSNINRNAIPFTFLSIQYFAIFGWLSALFGYRSVSGYEITSLVEERNEKKNKIMPQ